MENVWTYLYSYMIKPVLKNKLNLPRKISKNIKNYHIKMLKYFIYNSCILYKILNYLYLKFYCIVDYSEMMH